MQILKNGCDVVRRRGAADEPGSNILYTLKFCQIFVGESIEKCLIDNLLIDSLS